MLWASALLVAMAGSGADGLDRDWVERRVRSWQPSAQERAWERVGWAEGLADAQRLAKRHRRPVFLFTLDGRIGVGRC